VNLKALIGPRTETRDTVPYKTWRVAGPALQIVGFERFPAGWDIVADDGSKIRLWDDEDTPEWADD
jgi:hypothetical protein